MENKICAQCGIDFGCGRGDPSCWCSALPALSAAELDSRNDCLCARCLGERLADTTCDAHAEVMTRAGQ